MSADRPTTDPEAFVDDRDRPQRRDPHGIIPEAFKRRHAGASSYREALAVAARRQGDTDPDSKPRCPECGEVDIREKSGWVNQPQQRPEDWHCEGCGAHFDAPAPSREASRPGEQVELGEVSER